MSKGVFSSQKPNQTHTLMFSLDQCGREFLKADHKLIVFLTAPFSQRSGQILPCLYLCLTTPRNKPGLGASFRSKSQETLRAGDGLCLENEALEATQKQEEIGFQMEQTAQRKAYSVVLSKTHNNVTFTFVPLMSFLTEKLCNMLDSQALAFKATFNKSFIYFFSTNIYETNSARCQKYKDKYVPGLLLEGVENNSSLLTLAAYFQFPKHSTHHLI